LTASVNHDVAMGSLREGGADQFRQEDGERVRDENLTRLRANQGRDALTDAQGPVHPRTPTSHQALGPLMLNDLTHA
jgi:hypothetical protein